MRIILLDVRIFFLHAFGKSFGFLVKGSGSWYVSFLTFGDGSSFSLKAWLKIIRLTALNRNLPKASSLFAAAGGSAEPSNSDGADEKGFDKVGLHRVFLSCCIWLLCD